MQAANRCPTCGAALKPGQECPFCAEAWQLLQRLAGEEDVRLCKRCGIVLGPGDGDLCEECLREKPRAAWRRDDRIAAWIRDRIVEPISEREGIPCPSCQRPALPLAAFCPHCGQKLAGKILPEVNDEVLEMIGSQAGAAIAGPRAVLIGAETDVGASEKAQRDSVSEGVSAEGQGPIGMEGAAAEAPLVQRVWAFIQEQFRPAEPWGEEEPTSSFWQQVWGFLRALVKPGRGEGNTRTLLWALLGLLLLGLIAMAIFWIQMLSSGEIVFR